MKQVKIIYVSEALILKKFCWCESQEILFQHNLLMIYFRELLHGQIQLF